MRPALLLVLDLLIAASLLWLTFTNGWAAIASTAFLLVVRVLLHEHEVARRSSAGAKVGLPTSLGQPPRP